MKETRGRKPLSPSGERMKPRQIRMTDQQWADARAIGMEAIRRFITEAAHKGPGIAQG